VSDMSTVKLDQTSKTVKLNASTQHPLVFTFFDQLPETKREEEYQRALVIGVMALMEDRIAAFLSRTENELGTHLESLKLLYDRRRWEESRTAAGGIIGEKEVYDQLEKFRDRKGHPKDTIEMTGTLEGAIPRNKTGDIVIKFEGDSDRTIAVEVKFDKSLALGDWGDSDSTSRSRDTALSQLFESKANRESKYAVVVFDQNRCSQALLNAVGAIRWFPSAGFVVVIDHDRADYGNLFVVIDLLRSMTQPTCKVFDDSVLEALLSRISQDLSIILETKDLLKQNHQNLRKIAASIEKHAALVEFTKELIKEGLAEGQLNAGTLLKLYQGDAVVTKLKPHLELLDELFPGLT
jgi:hypothetical protein